MEACVPRVCPLFPAEEGSKGRDMSAKGAQAKEGCNKGMREESSPFVGPSRRLGSRPGECSVLEAAYIIIIRGDKGIVWVWPGVATEGSSCCRQASPGGPAGCGQGKGSVLSFIGSCFS